MRRFALAMIVVASAAVSTAAHADAHDDADRIFREGRALYDAGDYPAACTRFAESQRLEPAAGTLLNLADCYERIGRIATAWTTYKEAAVAASLRKRRDWEKFAQSRVDALARAVPMLMIRVSQAARVPGLVVTRNGDTVPPSDLEREVPVDPGRYVVVASAPDREPWSTTIDVGRGRGYVVEVTPTGVKETAKVDTAPPPPPMNRETSDWQRPVGFTAGAVGLGAIGFGIVAGVVAIGARSDAMDMCTSYPSACSPEGTASNERAYDWATVSSIVIPTGLVLTAAGTILVLTAPRKTSAGLGHLSIHF